MVSCVVFFLSLSSWAFRLEPSKRGSEKVYLNITQLDNKLEQ